MSVILECLIDWLGFEACAAVGPYDDSPSGVYLNGLPGINIETGDNIATSEQTTYKGLWDDIQKRAAGQFKIDVMAALQGCYVLNKECDYGEMICENLEILTMPWLYLCGAWFMKYRINSNRVNYFTTVGDEQAREMQEFYTQEYERFLKQAVLLMDTTGCEQCCGGNPEVVTWLP